LRADDVTPAPIDYHDISDLVLRVQALKELKRQGWVARGIPDPESVADHSYGVAVLALIFARRLHLDLGRVLTMALLHDLGESIIGDVIPADNIADADKAAAEEQAMRDVLGHLDPTGELIGQWLDFHYRRSPEGQLIGELDRLEMAFQADHYENATRLDLSEFFTYVEEKLRSPEFLNLLQRLQQDRSARRSKASGGSSATV
jgi:putative hydrolases of HD superfamily